MNVNLRKAFESIATPKSKAQVRLLDDNAEAYNARWKLLESAEDSIDAQYYTWDHDIFGMAQLGHVFHKARQGVDVRVMVDAVGDTFGQRGFKSHRGGKDYLQELVALPNAEAKVYHPHYKKLASFLLHPLGTEAIAANHDKILNVDGKAAVTGGRNTGKEYFEHPKDDPKAWRDADILVESPTASKELKEAFDVEFHAGWTNDTVQPDAFGNWKKRDVELLGAYTMMDSWLKGDPIPEANKDWLRTSPGARQAAAEQLVDQALHKLPELGVEDVSRRERKALLEMAGQLVKHTELKGSYLAPHEPALEADVKIVDKTSSLGEVDEMNPALLSMIENARESILLQTPYYVLTDPVIDALQHAGERGVKIKVATNSPSNTDSYFTQVFFLNDWQKSLETIPNLEVFAATGERKHHAKRAVIDGEIAVVGTYNLDLVSKDVNGEVAAIVHSEPFAEKVEQAVARDFEDPTVGYVQYGERFGPEDHVDPKTLQSYDKRIKRWNWARKHLPQLKSTRRFVEDK